MDASFNPPRPDPEEMIKLGRNTIEKVILERSLWRLAMCRKLTMATNARSVANGPNQAEILSKWTISEGLYGTGQEAEKGYQG